jgi:hypothetical protein
MRWIGIDEAGYGPNLGPLVMTAVIAEGGNVAPGPSDDPVPAPDLWRDLAYTVDRAGGEPCRLWVDDSKAILRIGQGRERLEATCMAVLDAAGQRIPTGPEELVSAVGAGLPQETELDRWRSTSGGGFTWPSGPWLDGLEDRLASKPLEPADGSWRIVEVRSVVLGPERFNRRLAHLESKARVHFSAFRELLSRAWELAADGRNTTIKSDKHGGRHYYLEPLMEAIPDIWIDRGPEGPELSEYKLRGPGRSVSLRLSPRADGCDGLVALASIVSKTIREVWMDVFNAFWVSRLDGLRPTAGYPVDAARFRRQIEPLARSQGLETDLWWRRK